MVFDLGQDAGLGDRVVGVPREQGAQGALDGVDPVAGHQQQPVRGLGFAVGGVGVFADRAGQALGGAARAEHRRQLGVLDGAFPRPRLGLALRDLPVRAGQGGVEPFPRHGRTVGRVQVGAPAGDAGAELVAVGGQLRLLGGVGRCEGRCIGHGKLLLGGQAALGTTRGLMQSSSLAENMW